MIALLSDFGLRDHYLGTMKGAILGIAPDSVLVDLTHDIPAHDILQGSLQLAAACGYFPAGTVFLAVVDPGVGSGRRAIAVEAGGYRFVAPDNGLLTAALAPRPPQRIVEVTQPRYALPTVSRTFEGRDRFGPAAAWLARGTAITELGPTVADYGRLDIPVPCATDDALCGTVLYVDRFGNAVTSIDRQTFDAFAGGTQLTIAAGGHPIDGTVDTYAEIPPDAVAALFGSTDRLEVAMRAASAAARLGLETGAPVVLSRPGAHTT
ncbi:MAG: SAM-dependent chlorinase/fluorinase [Vicinamibacterales bacterium]